VHLTLARIDGAPPGTKGLSLLAVPKKRMENGELVPNDVSRHRRDPQDRLEGACRASPFPSATRMTAARGLVGQPHRGLSYMFQMMNQARIMVGLNGASTASVAYHEALAYARSRTQGRPLTSKDPARPQVPIIQHADVRRMLLRQKAIVEGSLALVAFAAYQADLAYHEVDPDARHRASLLVDVLTPIAKPSGRMGLRVQCARRASARRLRLLERTAAGSVAPRFKSSTASTKAPPPSTVSICSDAASSPTAARARHLLEMTQATIARAGRAGVDPTWGAALHEAVQTLADLTAHLGGLGLAGDVEGMMLHSADFLTLSAITVVAWLFLWQAAVAQEGLARGDDNADFYRGKLCAAQYWIHTELPRTAHLAALCRSGEDSYARALESWF